MFTDPEVRQQVDGFLREKVQPHVTKLEQSSRDMDHARTLYEDLQNDPGDTYLALTEELFGPDSVESVIAALQRGEGTTEAESDEPHEADQYDDIDESALNQDDRQLLDELRQDRARKAYNDAITELQAEHEDIVPELFHPFVHSAGGDLERAYQGYSQWLGKAKSQFGGSAEIPDSLPHEVAPPTVGGSGEATSTPPVEKSYDSLDDALDDFFAGERSSAPPVVGSS